MPEHKKLSMNVAKTCFVIWVVASVTILIGIISKPLSGPADMFKLVAVISMTLFSILMTYKAFQNKIVPEAVISYYEKPKL